MRKIILILFIFSCTLYGQTTYLWTGNINTSFSTAGNWTPSRAIMAATDILIIEKGGIVNITNVNQITVGQLIIRNNTLVSMSPGPGNPRIISIQGVPGMQKKGEENKTYYIGDLKYNEYSDSESMGQDVDKATSKYNEYKIPDKKGMGDVKLADKEINKISVVNGIGDLKYSEHELFSFTDGDLVIDSSSRLEITSNDPKLSIFIKQNANAVILGSLIFSGTQESYINSYDANAIEFKTGSFLTQSCPGFIFTNSGISNSAIFDNGSIFNINNTQAANPYGLSMPNSKVKFEKGSTIKITASLQNLSFNGRKLPNLDIQNNSEVTVIDSSANFSVDSININPNSSLKLYNRNSKKRPLINIRGNLNVNGTLLFADSSYSFNDINFSGNSLQNIYGAGEIIFPATGEIDVKNKIRLHRDLVILCPINQENGSIDYNGYTIFSGNFGSPESIKLISDNTGNKNGINIPLTFSLSQNYPNPFNPKTKIDFAVPVQSHVTISVFDITGKNISIIMDDNKMPGYYTTEFDGTNIASGIYFYRIVTGTGNAFIETRKMVLVK